MFRVAVYLAVGMRREHPTLQVWAVLGSAEILGNPTRLVRSIQSSASDILRSSAAGNFAGAGIVAISGAGTLVKSSMQSVLDGVGTASGILSDGLARLTMDSDTCTLQVCCGPCGCSFGLLVV